VPAHSADHFSQAGLFFRSLTAVEQDHVVGAHTFELARCWESVIGERQLAALANIDGRLCARVAQGLGMTPLEPAVAPGRDQCSPALSQVGGTWPVAGRQVGIVAGPRSHGRRWCGRATHLRHVNSTELDALVLTCSPGSRRDALLDARAGTVSRQLPTDTAMATRRRCSLARDRPHG
jgi:hypothetical protein